MNHLNNINILQKTDKKVYKLTKEDKKEIKKFIKINEIKEKMDDINKFFEAIKPMKIWKTEYSFGLNDENAQCDIHDLDYEAENKDFKSFSDLAIDFAGLIEGKMKETTWFCPRHNKAFFWIKDSVKKEMKRLQRKLENLENIAA